jgi:hypothetical protein
VCRDDEIGGDLVEIAVDRAHADEAATEVAVGERIRDRVQDSATEQDTTARTEGERDNSGEGSSFAETCPVSPSR